MHQKIRTPCKTQAIGLFYGDGTQGERFELRIWPNDHGPPHVHVWKAGGVAKIELVDGFDLVKVREMRAMDVVRAVRIVIANEEKLTQAWEEIHGY